MSWGLENRLSRIIQKDGKTLMFAVDHGYFLGPITGLEQPQEMFKEVVPYADAIMLTRGLLTTSLDSNIDKPVILRMDGGPSIAGEKKGTNTLPNHEIMTPLEVALRLNASAIAISIFVGSEYETQTMKNLSDMVGKAEKYGLPVLAVTAVGADLDKLKAQETKEDRKNFRQYLALSCRMAAEWGAHIVKTYYCEDGFEEVTGSCLVPIVMAGGKSKGGSLAALEQTYNATKKGAIGVDMGRNIFQAENPKAMIKAIRSVVHEGYKPKKAYKIYKGEKCIDKSSSE